MDSKQLGTTISFAGKTVVKGMRMVTLWPPNVLAVYLDWWKRGTIIPNEMYILSFFKSSDDQNQYPK